MLTFLLCVGESFVPEWSACQPFDAMRENAPASYCARGPFEAFSLASALWNFQLFVRQSHDDSGVTVLAISEITKY